MPDFYEIDFLGVETEKSGDAIPLRYQVSGRTYIHVVDGGYQAEGAKVVSHIKQFYGNPALIDHVVCTHPDADHAGGLRDVLQTFAVGTLWMNRPWLYADELLPRFANYNSAEHLRRRLKAAYPHIAALEEIATDRGIPISPAFQGQSIGAFTVMTPTKARFLDLVVESERTPEAVEETGDDFLSSLTRLVREAVALIKSAWGEESFPAADTSSENAMSIVQYANLCGRKILLTGDTGRYGLFDTIAYAPYVGLFLPGLDRVQVPHHGSRHNISTDSLDLLLGPRLASQKQSDGARLAIVSSAKADPDHPRKSVVRAFFHRGYDVYATEGTNILDHLNGNFRGWGYMQGMTYPEEQEDD